MSLFMDLDSDWLLGGSQLIADYEPLSSTTFSSWDGYDASSSTQINGYVTVHSPTAAVDTMDYSMEVDSFIVSKSPVGNVEQFYPEMLPGSPEMGHLTNMQLQQYITQLAIVPDGMQFAANISSVTPITSVSATKQQVIDWKDFHSTPPVTLDIGLRAVLTSSDQAFATVPECETEYEDVIDLLNQLSDSVDGDMCIDSVDLEAFVSFPLDPVSPDDVESLISSQSSDVDTRATKIESSSFHAIDATEILVPLSLIQTPKEVSTVADAPVIEKKRKKQDQNKSAAIRYRQKKRHEHGSVMNECEELERRNIELKTKVSEMTKEVDYLKGLIEEICAA